MGLIGWIVVLILGLAAIKLLANKQPPQPPASA